MCWSPSPLCLLRCWSESPDFWSRDLAVTASDDRGSGEIAPGTPKEAHISGGRGACSIHRTQRRRSAEPGDAIVLKNLVVEPPRQRLLLNVVPWEIGPLDICKLLNFSEDIWLPIWKATESLALQTKSSCYFIVAVKIRVGCFFHPDTWGWDGAWGCLRDANLQFKG